MSSDARESLRELVGLVLVVLVLLVVWEARQGTPISVMVKDPVRVVPSIEIG